MAKAQLTLAAFGAPVHGTNLSMGYRDIIKATGLNRATRDPRVFSALVVALLDWLHSDPEARAEERCSQSRISNAIPLSFS